VGQKVDDERFSIMIIQLREQLSQLLLISRRVFGRVGSKLGQHPWKLRAHLQGTEFPSCG
jgi:hypothetical protein